MGFLEFLHRGKDDTVCLSAVKQRFQMLTAPGVHRLLTQKRLTFCELPEKLIVKVIAVSQHNDGRAVQCLLQKMGIEYHRQRLAAALGMPENAAFSVRLGGVSRGFHGFSDGKILMISREYLELLQAFAGKADEILDLNTTNSHQRRECYTKRNCR